MSHFTEGEKEMRNACNCENCEEHKQKDLEKEYESILDEAKEITGGDRMKAYGHPKENFRDIARLWTAYLNNKGIKCELDAKDYALMMVLMKTAREQKNHKKDNLTDGAGYFRNLAQIEGIE